MQLGRLQSEFLQSIFDPGREALEPWITPGALMPKKRVAIYRNNVFSNFRAALEAVYPAILRLVGQEFFHHAAQRYIKRYPSLSGDIHHFGREFAELLADLPGAAELAYLPDVARLEWAYHEVFHAAEHAPLDLARLQAVDPERYADLVFKLHPALRLLESPYPIRRIWEVNQPEHQGDPTVDLGQGGEKLLVTRRDFAVEVRVLPAQDFALLRAFADAQPFAAALENAAADFDVSAFLGRYALERVLVDFDLPHAA